MTRRSDLPAALRAARLPMVGAPLFIISNPDLVIAQCKAGVIGSFPALNAREAPGEPPMLDAWLRIFGTALRELRRAAEQSAAAPPSTQASDWEAGSSRVEGGPSGQTEPADHPEAGHPPSDEAR